ncbi:MAG TPA: TIGR02147 family protein [bacterium]|nr:TIGR02147 family protein [bacterium]
MTRPTIFDYEDYRLFLHSWYSWMKETKPGFSYRAFSKWAGFASPNHLQLIIQGKRNITQETLATIVKLLKLPKREARYFELLVELNQAFAPEAKARAILEISRLLKKFNRNIEHGQIEYLAKWYYAVIRELVTTKDFREDRHLIARRVGHGVSPRQVDEAVRKLTELGLLIREKSGRLQQKNSIVTTGSETTEAASYFYHDQMISLSAKALREQGPKERHFSGITLACRREDIPEITQILDECRRQVLSYLDERSPGEDDEVYQLNLQFFRVTKERKKP